MALSKAKVREILSVAGVDAEHMSDAVNAIIDGNVASIEALREEIANLKKELTDKEDATQNAQKELSELRSKVEAEAKEREGKDYDALKKEFDDYKAEQEAKATREAKKKALDEFLSDMKVSEKGKKVIFKYMGVDGVELDEDGKLKNATELRKSVKEDWGDYITTSETKGASTSNPPANNVGGTGKTKAEIMKIKDAGERQKAIRENPQLFGLPAEA